MAPFPESTPFARFILAEMESTYQPYVIGNQSAQVAGAKAFHAAIYGEDVSFLSRPYPEKSRQMIVDRINNALPAEEQQQVLDWLREVDLAYSFAG